MSDETRSGRSAAYRSAMNPPYETPHNAARSRPVRVEHVVELTDDSCRSQRDRTSIRADVAARACTTRRGIASASSSKRGFIHSHRPWMPGITIERRTAVTLIEHSDRL